MADKEIELSPEAASAYEEGKPVFYANALQVTTGLHDVRISCGKRNPLGPVSYDAHIYLSLPSAKQLSNILVDMIRQYEAAYGPIPLEPKAEEEKKGDS